MTKLETTHKYSVVCDGAPGNRMFSPGLFLDHSAEFYTDQCSSH